MNANALTPESALFNASGVTITPTRAIMGGRTYVMSNITSVTVRITHPRRAGGYFILFIGACGCLAGLADQNGATIVIGLVLIAVGYLKGIAAKDTHHVYLGSASGEGEAISSHDRAFIDGIVDALNEAIVQRG